MAPKDFLTNLLINSQYNLQLVDCSIVANTTRPLANIDRVANAGHDEFFSREEFAQIASAIYEVFGFVDVFYSEQDFIDKFIASQPINDVFVFNFSRNGIASGKKSLIPAFCDLYKIKYSGSDALTISLIRNKFFSGSILAYNGISIPHEWLFEKEHAFKNARLRKGQNYIVKNIDESASIGMDSDNIFVYQSKKELYKKLNALCVKLNKSKLLIQEFVDGKECEVLVFQYNKEYIAMDPIEILLNDRILDSTSSNDYDYGFALLSSSCGTDICNEIRRTAEHAAYVLNIKDYARFDFRIDSKGNFYLFDIAGTPYSIKHSSIAFLFTNVYNLKYSDIFRCIAASSLHNYNVVNCSADKGKPL